MRSKTGWRAICFPSDDFDTAPVRGRKDHAGMYAKPINAITIYFVLFFSCKSFNNCFVSNVILFLTETPPSQSPSKMEYRHHTPGPSHLSLQDVVAFATKFPFILVFLLC